MPKFPQPPAGAAGPPVKIQPDAKPGDESRCDSTADPPSQKNRWVVDLRPGRGIIGSVETSQTPKRNGRPVESPSGGRPAEIVGSEEAAVKSNKARYQSVPCSTTLFENSVVSWNDRQPRRDQAASGGGEASAEPDPIAKREGPRRRAARVDLAGPLRRRGGRSGRRRKFESNLHSQREWGRPTDEGFARRTRPGRLIFEGFDPGSE